MKIPCEEIKGFNKLNERCQSIFRHTYDCHYQSLGISAQEELTPTSVKLAKEAGKYYLKVTFNTGEWQHYLPDGVYY